MSKIKIPTPITEQLLHEIAEFLESANMSEREFGLKVVNNNKLVSRLKNNNGVWSSTIDKIRIFMATYKKTK